MNIKTLFLVCFLLTFFNIVTYAQAKDRVGKVVIDAGHGGTMPGTVGKLCKEKEINLKVALRVGKLIAENFDEVKVIYTRKTDETVDLFKRAEIANKNKADLFLSIHCNGADNKAAHGIETFVIGLGKSEESIAIAKKENADMLLEKDYQTNYSDFDPNSPEASIVFSLYSSAYLKSSTIIASKVQNHLVTNTRMADRTVQQAGFFVLCKVAMPSILIELGFISNAEEEKYLVKEETQELLAVSIFNAFVEYKNLIEGTLKPFLPLPKANTKPQPMVESPQAAEPPPVPEPDAITEFQNIDIQTIMISNTDTSVNLKTLTPPPSQTIAPLTDEIRFRVQFFISKDHLSTADKKFVSIKEVMKYYENELWKYTSGNFKTLSETQIMLKEVKKNFPDAFIIAFHNDRKISIQEAQELLK